MPNRIWQYYKRLAERNGTDSNGNDFTFSVAWFYRLIAENEIQNNLNNLSLAFLGDETAKNNVHVAADAELQAMCSRVNEICAGCINESQTEAVANALLNDITIIQGPPGTGKTETIKNILKCVSRIYPNAKTAVISANGEAISNAEYAVKGDPDLSEIYARLGAKKLRKLFKEKLATVNPQLNAALESCNKENEWLFPAQLLDRYPIIFSTIHSLKKCVDIGEYDYVIVDECSQVSSMLGMLAISSAKHLVLLGDDEQLPPIHKDRENDDNAFAAQIRAESPWYIDEKNNSFMKACKASFGEKCRSILLNEHYRCHPAIIEFCNKSFYNSQLITQTEDDGKLPIRIRWYEGDYWEKINPDGNEKAKNYNKKQIEIFVADELPDIIRQTEEDNSFSICVLSPYHYQLELLKERLTAILTENDLMDCELEESPDINSITQLTIHKAQGRGYDRVYILPVEDTGRNPWSQKRELINVAVSRAKKELVVITSSLWMSDKLQMELTGHSVRNTKSGKNHYIRDLLAYVEEQKEKRQVDEDYGFVNNSLSSVFDSVPLYRERLHLFDEKDSPDIQFHFSAPEYCLKTALENDARITGKQFDIYHEVPISELDGLSPDSEEIRNYIDYGARFDFVIAKDAVVYAIIEVDGAYHRCNPEVMHNDELKNKVAGLLGSDFPGRRFLRLPTDGTSAKELESIDLSNGSTVKLKQEFCEKRRKKQMIIGLNKNENGFISLNPNFNNLTGQDKKRIGKKPIKIINWESLSNALGNIPTGQHSIELNMSLDDIKKDKNGNRYTEIDLASVKFIRFGDRLFGNMNCLYYDLWTNIKDKDEKKDIIPNIIDFDIDPSTWDAGSVYDNNFKLQLYIFRMCYGYTAVYYYMFKEFFNNLAEIYTGKRVNLHVLSIGCGCKSDALALKYAIEGRNSITVSEYTGIDPGAWKDKQFYFDDKDIFIHLEAPYLDNECQKIQDLNDINEETADDNSRDIYAVIFPNMISEMKTDDLKQLLETIRDHYNKKELFLLLSRNPLNDNETRIDEQQAKVIEDFVANSGGKKVSEQFSYKGKYIFNLENYPEYNEKTGNILYYSDLYDVKYPSAKKMIQFDKYIQYEIYKM